LIVEALFEHQITLKHLNYNIAHRFLSKKNKK